MVLRTFVHIPLSWLYSAGVWIRHKLFDQRLIPSYKVKVPTICVGNLAVGGTGKTPMTAYIVQLLLDNGYHPAVLSRGYKRKTKGFVMADSLSTADTIGDEAMQLHETFPEVPIVVCESRVKGIKQLQRQIEGVDAVILDDAMQHRRLRSGFTVLLTAYDNLYIDDRLLPVGTLRDLPSRALKANVIVVTRCPEDIRPIDMRVIDNKLHLPTYQSLHFAGTAYRTIDQAGTPIVLTGIAYPQAMFEHVVKQYPQAQLLAYPDHYHYTEKDVEMILDKARNYDFVLTTEKDLTRLRMTTLEERLKEQGKALVALPIKTIFYTPEEAFNRLILRYIKENSRI